jgi:hypothetical protein
MKNFINSIRRYMNSIKRPSKTFDGGYIWRDLKKLAELCPGGEFVPNNIKN